MAVRSQRNNNPGNIRTNSTAWEGKVGDDGSFVTFATPEHGVRAMTKTLYTYQEKHGKRTLRDIIGRWAPPNENSTATYISIVSKETGINPDQPIDLRNNPKTTERVINAMIRMEGGNSAVNYFKPHVSNGIKMANGEVSTPTSKLGNNTLPGLGNPDILSEIAPELPEGVGTDSQTSTAGPTSRGGRRGSDIQTSTAGPTSRGGRRGSTDNVSTFNSTTFENMTSVLNWLEDEDQFWENELDFYENYSYDLEFLVVPVGESESFLNFKSVSFEQIINNQWPAENSNYVTIAKTGLTTEFTVDNLQIRSMGTGSGDVNKMVGTGVSLSFDLRQVGNTSINDTLIGIVMLMGYASIADATYYMKINFNGYNLDDPTDAPQLPTTKVIPFKLNKLKDITTTTNETGTIITLEGTIIQQMATLANVNITEYPFEFTIKDTLEETINSFIDDLNDVVSSPENTSYTAEQLRFLTEYEVRFDSSMDRFKSSSMISSTNVNTSAGNNTVSKRTNSINSGETVGNITPGLSVIDVLHDICIQSAEIKKEILVESETFNNVIRIEPDVIPKPGGYNVITGETGSTVIYNIIMKREFIDQNAANQLSKMQEVRKTLDEIFGTGRCRKVYYYHYTGLNDQILDLTVSLDRQLIKTYNTPKDSFTAFTFLKANSNLHIALSEKQQQKVDELQQQANDIQKLIDQKDGEAAKLQEEIAGEKSKLLSIMASQKRSTVANAPPGARDEFEKRFQTLQEALDNGDSVSLAALQREFPEEFAELKNNEGFNRLQQLDKQLKEINNQRNTEQANQNKIDSNIKRRFEEQLGIQLGDALQAQAAKQSATLSQFSNGGFILAEELGDDLISSKMDSKSFGALLDTLILNPLIFKRAIIPSLMEEKKPRVFKVPDQEEMELARQKFYESLDGDTSMHQLSMTIKGDPFWLEYYLTKEQQRTHFGQNNTNDNNKGFFTNINGNNYFVLVVNKADGVDEHDNIMVEELEIFIYLVRSTISSFSGGMFTQTFDAIRIPVPRFFKDIPRLEAIDIEEELDAFGGFGDTSIGVDGVTGGNGIFAVDEDGNIQGAGGNANVGGGDGNGFDSIAFQEGVDTAVSNPTVGNLSGLLSTLGGTNINTEDAQYLLNSMVAEFGEGVDGLPDDPELRSIYTELMTTAAGSAGIPITDLGFTESNSTPELDSITDNTDNVKKVETLTEELETVTEELDVFELDPEVEKERIKEKERLEEEKLIEENNTSPFVLDTVTVLTNPETGETETRVQVKPSLIDQPVIIPKPPGALPSPAIDNGDGTITVPITTATGDIITVSEEVSKELRAANDIWADVRKAIENLPRKEVQETFDFGDGNVETFTELYLVWDEFPDIPYTDANGNTQVLTAEDLGITSFSDNHGLTPAVMNNFISRIGNIFPNITTARRKQLDPENAGGPLRTEIGSLDVFTPIEEAE